MVCHGDDEELTRTDAIDNVEGEAPDEHAPRVFFTRAAQFGVVNRERHRPLYFLHELLAKPCSLSLVMRRRLVELHTGFLEKRDPANAHLRSWARTSANTSAAGMARVRPAS